ncbi:MAG: hypothetical protein KDK70_40055 [Myxococcales bacterium]|nr:hypothetical protein [Myxococcales bacterium]
MTCDILIRSYWRDLEWLAYCLDSIARFCRGFRRVIVVIPASSRPWLDRRGPLPGWVELQHCDDSADDYLGQQITKLHADERSDADFICHVDSDCIFCRPTEPRDLIVEGRPRIYTRPLPELGHDWPWTEPTRDFLGWSPSHDFMQCPPFTYPRWLYPELRAWSRARHGMALRAWVASRPPRGFSEFNVLGAWALEHHAERFEWIRAVDIGAEERHCRWYWSWGGIEAPIRAELAQLLAPGGPA